MAEELEEVEGPAPDTGVDTGSAALSLALGRAGKGGKSGVDEDAPKWGRNRLRWGEALMLAGRYREARAQFEAADALEMSAPDRAALKVLLDRTAAGPLHG